VTKTLTNRDGISLVLSVVVLAVLLIISVGMANVVRSIVRESIFQTRMAESHAIAEAGIEDGLYQLRLSAAMRSTFTKSFAGGTYTVSYSAGTPPVVMSVGTSVSLPLVGGAKTQIQATSASTGGSAPTVVCPILASVNKAFIQGTIDAYDSSLSTNPVSFSFGANVCSNSNVQIQGGAQNYINGDAYYGSTPAPDASQVRGTVYLSTFTRTVPTHDGSAFLLVNNNLLGISPLLYYNAVSRALNIPSGATVTMQPGTYYLADITINSNGTLIANTGGGTVTIYTNGDFNLQGILTNTSGIPSRLLIYPQGSRNISLKGNTSLYGVVEGSNAAIFSTQVVYGKLSGSSLNLINNLHYDTQTDGASGAVSHVSWTLGTWSVNPQ
jgi:hypothetical protein